ncbi:uncharacterized protein LOC112057242 [Bicyclus anynana]|uniref:Uncharacterized protein LOC112057242 n=1 Tax=Bicyclus anynana TaxID=110368 RepID=A0A6J1P6P5_BICAN|nr:uncharacterized protein LOC112057242 [Bicyclus anynana]
MRRGHPGIGGWRNENPRHFRPRIGGNPHFRPPRNYGIQEPPRFPPPFDNSRPIRYNRSDKSDRKPPDHSERYRYRDNQNAYKRPHQQGDRQQLPSLLQWKPKGDVHRNTPNDSSYQNQMNDRFHINNMGDIDHRHSQQTRDNYIPPFISPWAADYPQQQSGNTGITYRQDRDYSNKPSVPVEYTGHRPPASDHYGGNPASVIDSTNTFSRSVDDTVDLVRKRLLSRNDPQNASDNFENCQDNTALDSQNLEKRSTFQNTQNNPPIKKKYQSKYQNHMGRPNCAKIKDKIVHQLFKMDKEKIHKLMDNPNSSTKFEYAISSLITESQNSFNRHLRSTAEKSLCGLSSEFIENDNNTLYEDTFLKQMQCMLDPQDTIFLEDIKPFVMAEINKALQIGEYKQTYHIGDEGIGMDNIYEFQNYNPNADSDNYKHEDYSTEEIYSGVNNIVQRDYQRSKSVEPCTDNYRDYDDDPSHYEDPKQLFERRKRTKSFSYQDSIVSETPSYGRETEEKPDKEAIMSPIPHDLFDANAEQISDDEDPFAELDKQYHVAVDHDFIEQDDIPSPKQVNDLYNSNYTNVFKTEPLIPERKSKNFGEEIKTQPKDMAKSTLILPNINLPIKTEINYDTFEELKQESLCSTNVKHLEQSGYSTTCNSDKTRKQNESGSKEITKEADKTEILGNQKTMLSNPRKRSSDQRPSHRKEKKKKSESSVSEASKQILNKNIIINVNDCASKASEKCENSKSIFNLFFSKEQSKVSKDNNTIKSNDKNYVEKHAKRKETSRKSTDKNSKTTEKIKDSTSNQLASPTENSNINNICDTPTKPEKTILKPIDMFNEQPKKSNVIHQAHRNTAPIPILTPKSEITKKSKLKGPLCKQLSKKHIGIQVMTKMHTKQTQTPPSKCGTQFCQPKKKYSTISIQTDLCIPDKTGNKSSDAFERMKQIDLEIQVLLQEKFKLYSSIESKETGTSSMQNLGMAVLNVTPFNEDEENKTTDEILSEDIIVNEFANIPEEELEQIALEAVQTPVTVVPNQRSRRRKVPFEVSHSHSPVTVQKKKKLKAKPPNISLIEQIIRDDRPLEDIISLDDFEIPPRNSKNKNTRNKKSKKKATRITSKGEVNKPTKKKSINFIMKECSVVLKRINITPFLKSIQKQTHDSNAEYSNKTEEDTTDINRNGIDLDTNLNIVYEDAQNMVEETVVNDIQFDMLDVSEDIVVGDNCEVKSLDKEETILNENPAVCEEIILDNSQSSIEDTITPAVDQGSECKMYDFSADENLRRDSVVVSGNADAVLALECVESNFLAACLDGNVYYFSNDGQLLTTLKGSNLAVTCLTIVKEKHGTTVYTGSLDSRIRYYDLETGLEKGLECNVLSPIQTMDRAWDTVFVGTRTGFVLQFECKNNMLIPVSSVKFSDQSILALRAMKEGPRKVLLVAARSESVTIKDAQTGLLLRTLDGPKMTVYSLLYEDGKIFCGTSSHQIHVFDYASGSHAGTHSGGKGAVCLRAVGGLLFAGCYDGCVYVYREGEGTPFAQIRGPSLMLLSLAVVGSKIIAGYKDRSLYIWKIPLCILQEMIL